VWNVKRESKLWLLMTGNSEAVNGQEGWYD